MVGLEIAARTLPLARQVLTSSFLRTRAETERLAAPLHGEDQQLQAMPEASPTKWHRAHTTWFFEMFLLLPHGVPLYDERWAALFNSYYDGIAPRLLPRTQRGLLSRPTLEEVGRYRRVVDERVVALLARLDADELAAAAPIIELGIAHEEQHQELLLTDILAAFADSPLRPAYECPLAPHPVTVNPRWQRVRFEGGLVSIGAPEQGTAAGSFAFDCERPRHRVWLEPFSITSRPISVGDVKLFIEDAGYARPALWLADGWAWAQRCGAHAPGHSRFRGGALVVMTLRGEREAHDDEPASHLSYYEADAIARFLGGRLPSEQEWEHAAAARPASGRFRDDGALLPLSAAPGPWSMTGEVWEWTRSSFAPYPGFRAVDGCVEVGAPGEYNGKFMHGQMVLRGGSCLTNRAHLRLTTRSFWPPATRFQMSGARVAFDEGYP